MNKEQLLIAAILGGGMLGHTEGKSFIPAGSQFPAQDSEAQKARRRK
jgi:hypothetical protein